MVSRVLKVFHGDDVRRVRIDMPADDQQCFEAVQAAVVKAFGMQNGGVSPTSVALMCKDEEVLCELTATTLRKLLNESDDTCLRLYICETGCDESLPTSDAPQNSIESNDDTQELEGADNSSLQGNVSEESSSSACSQHPFVKFGTLLQADTKKTPEHVGEGFLQGLHRMGDHVGHGIETLRSEKRAGKGTGKGLVSVGLGVWKGWFDLHASTWDGLRHTPDLIADQVNKERLHNKHGVEGEGKGKLLETKLEDREEPQHFIHGLERGIKGFSRGVSGGFQALVKRPREAFKQKGLEGLPRGLGEGVLGLGTNVAAGVLDYTTNVSLGWKNTPEAVAGAFQKKCTIVHSSMPVTPPSMPVTPPSTPDTPPNTPVEVTAQDNSADASSDLFDVEDFQSVGTVE